MRDIHHWYGWIEGAGPGHFTDQPDARWSAGSGGFTDYSSMHEVGTALPPIATVEVQRPGIGPQDCSWLNRSVQVTLAESRRSREW